MIIANTDIVAGEKTFQRGQAVKGLSPLDKSWMLAAGYISEIPDASPEQRGKKAQKPGPDTPLAAKVGEGE